MTRSITRMSPPGSHYLHVTNDPSPSSQVFKAAFLSHLSGISLPIKEVFPDRDIAIEVSTRPGDPYPCVCQSPTEVSARQRY